MATAPVDLKDHAHTASLIDGIRSRHETRLAAVLALSPTEARDITLRDGIPVWRHVELGTPVRCEACDREQPWTPATGWVESDGWWLCTGCAASWPALT